MLPDDIPGRLVRLLTTVAALVGAAIIPVLASDDFRAAIAELFQDAPFWTGLAMAGVGIISQAIGKWIIRKPPPAKSDGSPS